MCKLKPGDRFHCTLNGLCGLIKKISWNSIYGYEEYIVEWDGHPGKEHGYDAAGCDLIWELQALSPNSANAMTSTTLPYGAGSLQPRSESDILDSTKYTLGQYSDAFPGIKNFIKPEAHVHTRKTYVGFTESYDYCESCGVKL